jgi:hypothetical protein
LLLSKLKGEILPFCFLCAWYFERRVFKSNALKRLLAIHFYDRKYIEFYILHTRAQGQIMYYVLGIDDVFKLVKIIFWIKKYTLF